MCEAKPLPKRWMLGHNYGIAKVKVELPSLNPHPANSRVIRSKVDPQSAITGYDAPGATIRSQCLVATWNYPTLEL
jgi:hypothetical protein